MPIDAFEVSMLVVIAVTAFVGNAVDSKGLERAWWGLGACWWAFMAYRLYEWGFA